MTSTIIIPNTIEDALGRLEGIEKLLTAKGWEKAAIVAAFVRLPGQGGRTDLESSSQVHTPKSFAELGIKGLTSMPAVRRYVQAWLDTHDGVYPEPGAKVELPDIEWPPEEKNEGSRIAADPVKAIEQLIEKHGPQAIAEAVRRPEVADKVLTDIDAGASLIRAQGRIREGWQRDVKPSRPSTGGGLVGALQKAIFQIEAMAYADYGEKLLKTVAQHKRESNRWTSEQLKAVRKDTETGIQAGQDVLALLTDITDESLAEWLGQ